MDELLKRFIRERVAPIASRIDATGEFPAETLKEMGKLGFLGIMVPQAYGGVFTGYSLYYRVIRELAKICSSHALTLISHSLCCHTIALFGHEQQKQKYLPPLASGKLLGANAMTEPDAGSDLSSIKTYSRLNGDFYILNGKKHFITNGSRADVLIVLAATSKQKNLFRSSLFILEKGMDGFSVGRQENKMGFRASDTSELFFENVKLPRSNLLGMRGQGILEIAEAMECSRLAVASLAIGIAEAAFEEALSYSRQRKQFGKPIARFQGIQFYLADMATDIESAKCLVKNAAQSQDQGKRVIKEAAMAKYYSSEMAFNVVSKAMQIFGGYGYIKDLPLERYLRDSRLCMIIEGPNEIQRLIIAKNL